MLTFLELRGKRHCAHTILPQHAVLIHYSHNTLCSYTTPTTLCAHTLLPQHSVLIHCSHNTLCSYTAPTTRCAHTLLPQHAVLIYYSRHVTLTTNRMLGLHSLAHQLTCPHSLTTYTHYIQDARTFFSSLALVTPTSSRFVQRRREQVR
jgi:hypothetical protein